MTTAIAKILIQNFQKHEKFKIDLDQITVITGPTDAGKSSVLRAFRWTCLNQPTGDSCVRNGSKGAVVKLVFENERSVGRKRGRGQNLYLLDGKDFKSFGQGSVPEPIAEYLNISELNFQDQHDPPFWLSLSAPEVSRQINAIVDLGIIDSAMTKAGQKVRESRSVDKICRERLADAEDTEVESRWVIQADAEYREIEARQVKIEENQEAVGKLTDLIKSVVIHKERAETAGRMAEDGEAVLESGKRLGRHEKLAKELSEAIESARRHQSSANRELPSMDGIAGIVEKWQAGMDRIRELKRLIGSIGQRRSEMDRLSGKVEGMEESFKDRMGGVCPVCGGEIGAR